MNKQVIITYNKLVKLYKLYYLATDYVWRN